MRMRPTRVRRKERGVTFIELVIVLGILSLLASVVLPLGHISNKRVKEFELKSRLRIIRSAIDAYKKAYDDKRILNEIDRSGYPESLLELVEGVEDVKDPEGRMLYFLRRLPRDPMNDNEFLAPEETWETRAYEGDPDDFSGGEDVFDVRSMSTELALDGTEYREW